MADAVPHASDDVNEAEKRHHHQENVGHKLDTLGADVLKDELGELLRLDQSEQPHQTDRPQHAQQAQRGRILAALTALQCCEHGLDPVAADQGKVEAEARADVAPGHLGGPQLDEALRRHVAREERDEDVHGPEAADQPREQDREGGLRGVEDLQRDRDDVVGHEAEAQDLPRQVLQGARGDDEALEAALEPPLRRGVVPVALVPGVGRAVAEEGRGARVHRVHRVDAVDGELAAVDAQARLVPYVQDPEVRAGAVPDGAVIPLPVQGVVLRNGRLVGRRLLPRGPGRRQQHRQVHVAQGAVVRGRAAERDRGRPRAAGSRRRVLALLRARLLVLLPRREPAF
mmetsp:Transcript_173437/g.421865  ORF Transcript_173437/g.421865 Transcript_173437/m.421865 type:complete len:343 (+) Transcript_173437:90-1118(+)